MRQLFPVGVSNACARFTPRSHVLLSSPQVITDTARRMGEGMAEFISKDVATTADYDRFVRLVSTTAVDRARTVWRRCLDVQMACTRGGWDTGRARDRFGLGCHHPAHNMQQCGHHADRQDTN